MLGLGPSLLRLCLTPSSLRGALRPAWSLGFPAGESGPQDVQVSLALRPKGKVSEVRSRGASAPSPQHGPPSEGAHSPASLLRRRLVLDPRLGDWEIGTPLTISLTPRQVRGSLPSAPHPRPWSSPLTPAWFSAGSGAQLTPSMVVPEAAPASFIPWDPGLSFLPVSRTSLHLHILIPPAAFPIPPCHFPPLLPSPCPAVFTPVPALGWDFYGGSRLAAVSGLPPSWSSRVSPLARGDFSQPA